MSWLSYLSTALCRWSLSCYKFDQNTQPHPLQLPPCFWRVICDLGHLWKEASFCPFAPFVDRRVHSFSVRWHARQRWRPKLVAGALQGAVLSADPPPRSQDLPTPAHRLKPPSKRTVGMPSMAWNAPQVWPEWARGSGAFPPGKVTSSAGSIAAFPACCA